MDNDAHYIYPMQFVSLFCRCEFYILQDQQKCRIIFRCIGSAKQKAVHCTAMIAKTSNDQSADMDYHGVPPPDDKAGGDSKGEEL